MVSLVASRFQLARERRRELGVDEEAQSGGPQDGVVALPGGKLQHCGDVFGFEVWVVCENLFARSAGSQEVEHVLHADAQATNARTAPADVWAHRNTVERAHRSIVARLRLLGGERQDSLLRQVGGIRQRRVNARQGERGIALDDLLGGQPVRQVRKNRGNGDSCAANACLAVENGRIDGDVFAPVHLAIVANVCGLLGTDSRGGRDA